MDHWCWTNWLTISIPGHPEGAVWAASGPCLKGDDEALSFLIMGTERQPIPITQPQTRSVWAGVQYSTVHCTLLQLNLLHSAFYSTNNKHILSYFLTSGCTVFSLLIQAGGSAQSLQVRWSTTLFQTLISQQLLYSTNIYDAQRMNSTNLAVKVRTERLPQ